MSAEKIRVGFGFYKTFEVVQPQASFRAQILAAKASVLSSKNYLQSMQKILLG